MMPILPVFMTLLLGPQADNLQLIKKLSATPIIHAQEHLSHHGGDLADSQASLQANKATFFFRLVE